MQVPSAAKYPLPPKSGRFCEKNSLCYLDLCYVNPRQPQIKDLPSIIDCEPIRSFKKEFSQNLTPLG